jgi:hypothetical protein
MNKGVNKKSLPARVQEKLLSFIWGGPAEFQGAQNALFLTPDLSPRLTLGGSLGQTQHHAKSNVHRIASSNNILYRCGSMGDSVRDFRQGKDTTKTGLK